MGDTQISWTHRPGTRGRTWNPIRGCSRVSEGCTRCYAERTAGRFGGPGKPFDGLVKITAKGARWTGVVRLVTDRLADPLRWRQPSTVFANSMSDLFHEGLGNEEIAAVFGVMAACSQHTFQCLTKRANRMREWFEWAGRLNLDEINDLAYRAINGSTDAMRVGRGTTWPLPNVWIGVSVENQSAADERIPELLETPAAVRFLSCEPLLGAVDISEYFDPCSVPCGEDPWPDLDWVIAGCESGPGMRDCDPAWLRSLRDQCAAAGVPYYLKQARPWDEGRHHPIPMGIGYGPGSKRKTGGVVELPYLDGKQHVEWPR